MENSEQSEHSLGFEITLLVKADNRKKHNSHEWFLGNNGFLDCKKARFALMTDVGTLFKDNCVWEMRREIELQPKVGGTICRSIGMTTHTAVEFQRGFWLQIIRRIQYHTNEMWNVSYLAFSFTGKICCFAKEADGRTISEMKQMCACVCVCVGFSSVLAGPCAMMHHTNIRACRSNFFRFLDETKSENPFSTLAWGNARTAEDAMLTYMGAMSNPHRMFTTYCERTAFYFTTERGLRTYMAQQRRWTNGGLFAQIWLFFTDPRHLFYHIWDVSVWRKVSTFILFSGRRSCTTPIFAKSHYLSTLFWFLFSFFR